MNARQVQKLSWRLLKLKQSLDKAAKKDIGLKAIADGMDKIWEQSYKLHDARALAEAQRKDRGEVCWTLFFPRDYGWEAQKLITRTPNCVIQNRSCVESKIVARALMCIDAQDPWEHLDKEWSKGRETYTLDKMRTRAARVASEWPREQQRLAEAA